MRLAIYSAIVGLIVGAACAWYFFPRYKTQTETKTVTEYKTRVVERWRKNPDGTETGERTTESSGQQTATKSEGVQEKLWAVSVTAETLYNRLEPTYGLEVERTLVGPIFATVSINTKQEIKVGLGWEF
jgi:hypothetical protein